LKAENKELSARRER